MPLAAQECWRPARYYKEFTGPTFLTSINSLAGCLNSSDTLYSSSLISPVILNIHFLSSLIEDPDV